MHSVAAVIREVGKVIVAVGGGDSNDVWRAITRGVRRCRIVIRRTIAGGCYEQYVATVRSIDFVQEGLGKTWSNPTVGEHPNIHWSHRACKQSFDLDCELDRLDRAGYVASAVRSDEFQPHNARGPVDPHATEPIVSCRTDRSRYMRAVTVIVHGIATVRYRVESVRPGGACDGGSVEGYRECRGR